MTQRRKQAPVKVRTGPEKDVLVNMALVLLLIAAVLVILYMISRMGSVTSSIILAIIAISTIAAIWYNHLAHGGMRTSV